MQDDQSPITKADLKRFEAPFFHLEGMFERRLNDLQMAIDRVLDVLINIERRLTLAVGDHERRICRLEHRLGETNV